MKRYPLIYALVALLAVGASARAHAMEGASPNDVSIIACRAERSMGPDTDSGAFVETGHGVRIVFENRGSAVLSKVTFALEQDGQSLVREDLGRFSPGVRIDHYFAAVDLPETGTPICSVIAVRGNMI